MRSPDTTNEERQHRVDEVLDDFGLTPHRTKRVAKQSAGQRNRVSVAAFAMLEDLADPKPLREKLLASPLGRGLDTPAANAPAPAPDRCRGCGLRVFARELKLFTSRYVRLLLADRRALLTVLLQAPIIAGARKARKT